MRQRAARILRGLAGVAAATVLFNAGLQAQGYVLVTCQDGPPCRYQRVAAITVQGKNTVKTTGVQAAADARAVQKARAMRLDSLAGLYREPKSGAMRILGRDGRSVGVAWPSKLPSGALTASSAWEGATLEYREQARSKTGVAVPLEQFVALLSGASLEGAVVDFIRNEVSTPDSHPMEKGLIEGAMQFAARSPELRAWRDGLRSTMRASLDRFRNEQADPARLESILAEGLAAMRVYRLVSADGEKEEELQNGLTAEHRRLVERFAVAGAFKKAGMHDAYIEKMEQIGLASWSRPELRTGIENELRASSAQHHKLAEELFAARQYARAFDEAQLASSRTPCDQDLDKAYYAARVEFVDKNRIPASPEYENQRRSQLQQIIRELQASSQEGALTPERIEYVRKRIVEGEGFDKEYLPLQFQKAVFLANLGELTAAREVVIRAERTAQFGPKEVEQWLSLDASLNAKLATLRQRTEKAIPELFAEGQFKEALDAALAGSKAEPANPKLLYLGALASAVIRDRENTTQLVERYLRSASPACMESGETNTLFDLYRSEQGRTRTVLPGRIPHWISGEPYLPGEVFYDPLSGGFFPQVSTTGTDRGTATEFHWDGYLVTSITTWGASVVVGRIPVFEVEPRYDREHAHMVEIGTKANSTGERRAIPLLYLNSPAFDPLLAAKFTGKMLTRGWAGNPFFHPFLWTGIYVFDLSYDELGRIREAIPANVGVSGPRSPYSEPLKFTWDGNSKRLVSIKGARYSREMEYDRRGRLRSEKVAYVKGRGTIDYEYSGDSMLPKRAVCSDNFLDKVKRTVTFRAMDQ